ncbi:MAG: DUF4129 domain-containing protein [Acidobacteriota bacterium]
MSRSNRLEVPALDLVEQTVELLRAAPMATWMLYYVGALPFVLGLLYFWVDATYSALAAETLFENAAALGFLFAWMKCWQTAFASHLADRLTGVSRRWTLRRGWRLISSQVWVQATGLFVIPVALFLVVPFGWVHAMYQHYTVLADGEAPSTRQAAHQAWRQAQLWPLQNHLVIWLLSPWLLVATAGLVLVLVPWIRTQLDPSQAELLWLLSFGVPFLLAASPLNVAVAVNIAASLILLPYLLKMLLGIETRFTLSGPYLVNSTFFALVCSLTYLCLDPFLKAAYVVRCFQARSRYSGEDLKSVLREWVARGRTAALVLVFVSMGLLIPCAMAQERRDAGETGTEVGQPRRISEEELDRAIGRVLAQREYLWRLPADDGNRPKVETPAFLETARRWLDPPLQIVRKIRNWYRRLLRRPTPVTATQDDRTGRPKEWIIVLTVASGIVACLLMWRIWRRRRQPARLVVAEPAVTQPDLASEEILPSQLPEHEWLALAHQLRGQGDHRLALRSLYLASLAFLAEQGLLSLARFKSNREYLRELTRRARLQPQIASVFEQNVGLFEPVWYGQHPAGQDSVDRFLENLERIRADVG